VCGAASGVCQAPDANTLRNQWLFSSRTISLWAQRVPRNVRRGNKLALHRCLLGEECPNDVTAGFCRNKLRYRSTAWLSEVPDWRHVVHHANSLIALVVYVTGRAVGRFAYLGRDICARAIALLVPIIFGSRFGFATKYRSTDQDRCCK
jgi:hypothetical protein